jgi:hypothetical protein
VVVAVAEVVAAEAVAGEAVTERAAPLPTARPTDRTAAAARGVAGLVDLRCLAGVRPKGRTVLMSFWLTARESDVRRAVTGMVVSRRL